MSRFLNFKIAAFVAVLLLSVLPQANADQLNSLYDVEILVVDESADVRKQAFNQGLEDVFIRIAGDSTIMDRLKPSTASRYVKQFSYSPVEKPEIDEEGEIFRHSLNIQFNGNVMEKYLLDKGFPVWGEHRPEVVIWLAVRDGQNEYILKKLDKSLLKLAVDKAMVRRGITESWPLYDAKDRQILKIVDIRGGFKEPLIAASERYSSGPVLAASLIWNGEQWQSNWSLLMASSDQYWSIVDSDYEQLIKQAINKAADTMGAVYAISHSAKNLLLNTVHLDIQSVTSIEQFRQLENYLTGFNVVDFVIPVSVDGSSVLYEVRLNSDEEDFLKMIMDDARLIEAESQPAQQPVQQSVQQVVSNNFQNSDSSTTGLSTTDLSSMGKPLETDAVTADGLATTEAEKNSAVTKQMPPQYTVYHYKFIK